MAALITSPLDRARFREPRAGANFLAPAASPLPHPHFIPLPASSPPCRLYSPPVAHSLDSPMRSPARASSSPRTRCDITGAVLTADWHARVGSVQDFWSASSAPSPSGHDPLYAPGAERQLGSSTRAHGRRRRVSMLRVTPRATLTLALGNSSNTGRRLRFPSPGRPQPAPGLVRASSATPRHAGPRADHEPPGSLRPRLYDVGLTALAGRDTTAPRVQSDL